MPGKMSAKIWTLVKERSWSYNEQCPFRADDVLQSLVVWDSGKIGICSFLFLPFSRVRHNPVRRSTTPGEESARIAHSMLAYVGIIFCDRIFL